MLFSYPTPPHWKTYSEVFDCPVEFEAKAMEWHFDSATLAQPLPEANHLNAGVFEAMCAQMAQAPAKSCNLVRRKRQVCLDSEVMPSATEMAAQFNVSLRSLYRRLASEATSYQVIVDSARSEVAMQMLHNRDIPLELIRRRVGFREATNFSKAFRRWTGVTPGEYRRRVAGS